MSPPSGGPTSRTAAVETDTCELAVSRSADGTMAGSIAPSAAAKSCAADPSRSATT